MGHTGKRGSGEFSLISHSVFIVATWIAAVCGGIGIAAAFISAIVGYQLTEESLGKANERIASAESRARTDIAAARSDAEAKIGVAREEARAAVETAQADIATANRAIEQARVETANAVAETSRLTRDAEELRGKNLLLEKAVAPRELEQYRTVQNLKQFSDMKFIVLANPDPEARRMAAQIRFMLVAAGWKRVEGAALLPPPPVEFPDGVTIQWGSLMQDLTRRSRRAMNAVIAELKANNIEAMLGQRLDELAPDGLRILVGLKPAAGHHFQTMQIGSSPHVPEVQPGSKGNMIFE